MKNKFISILLSVMMLVVTLSAGTMQSFASSGSDVYMKQMESGKCTLASAVMMMRQKALMEGNSTWSNLTQEALLSTAWITGSGLRHSFTYYGITVGYGDLPAAQTSSSGSGSSGDAVQDDKEDNSDGSGTVHATSSSESSTGVRKAAIISLLKAHPEGIEIYERGLPHAVYLTRYDSSTDTFYCADPALSATEIKLENSWLSRISSSADQDYIIEAIDSYWYVKSYTASNIPEYTVPVSSSDDDDDSSADNGGVSNENQGEILENNPGGVITSPSSQTSVQNTTVKFDRVNDFSTTNFKDIDHSEWYIDYIEAAYEMGLMNGVTSTEFSVSGNLTIAQAITMSARIYSTFMEDGHSFKQAADEEWYTPYVEYAYSKGIITSKYMSDVDFNADATRAQFAEIVAGSLPDRALVIVNNVDSGDIIDVDENTSSGKAVYKLYRAGVLTGDSTGTFNPNDYITRSQVAAVVSRIADSSMRVAS